MAESGPLKLSCMLIDKSGSMHQPDQGGTKLEVAKEMARGFIDSSSAGMVKIWFFDTSFHNNLTLDSVVADGGTDISNCLRSAMEEVAGLSYDELTFQLVTDAEDKAFNPEPHRKRWQRLCSRARDGGDGTALFVGQGGGAVGSCKAVFDGSIFHNPNKSLAETNAAKNRFEKAIHGCTEKLTVLEADTEAHLMPARSDLQNGLVEAVEQVNEKHVEMETHLVATVEVIEDIRTEVAEDQKEAEMLMNEVRDFKGVTDEENDRMNHTIERHKEKNNQTLKKTRKGIREVSDQLEEVESVERGLNASREEKEEEIRQMFLLEITTLLESAQITIQEFVSDTHPKASRVSNRLNGVDEKVRRILRGYTNDVTQDALVVLQSLRLRLEGILRDFREQEAIVVGMLAVLDRIVVRIEKKRERVRERLQWKENLISMHVEEFRGYRADEIKDHPRNVLVDDNSRYASQRNRDFADENDFDWVIFGVDNDRTVIPTSFALRPHSHKGTPKTVYVDVRDSESVWNCIATFETAYGSTDFQRFEIERRVENETSAIRVRFAGTHVEGTRHAVKFLVRFVGIGGI